MRKWTIIFTVFAFSLFIKSTSLAAGKVELGLAGAGPASLAYNLVAGVAENTNTKTDLVRVTPETSAGFVENIRLIGRGETELAIFGGTFYQFPDERFGFLDAALLQMEVS